MIDLPKGLTRIKGVRPRYELSVFQLTQAEFDLVPKDTRFIHETIAAIVYVKGRDDKKFLERHRAPFRIGFFDGKPRAFIGKRRVSSIPGEETTWRLLLQQS